MLVELSSERDRYLDLSKSHSATTTVCGIETEKNVTLNKTLRDLQAQLVSNENLLKELQSDKTNLQASFDTQASTAKQAIDDMKAVLTSEQQKNEELTNQATECERKLHALTEALEAEKKRCLDIQSGLGQKTNE